MKALVYTSVGNMEYKEWKDPAVDREHNVLIKIKAVGICGSDIQGYLGKTDRRIAPMVMGHEVSGEVVSIMEGTDNPQNFKPGDRVVLIPFANCGSCDSCKAGATNFCKNYSDYYGILSYDGGMQEYLAVQSGQLIKIPNTVSFEYGALCEPLAVGYSAASKVTKTEKPILLVGAGTIGLFSLLSLVQSGHRKIVVCDRNERRLSKARKLGATLCVTPSQLNDRSFVEKISEGMGFCNILDAVGVPETYAMDINVASNGGVLVWVGNACREVTVPIPDLVNRELTIRGSFIYTKEDFRQATDIIISSKYDFNEFIELKAPLSNGADVFKRLASREDIIKALLID